MTIPATELAAEVRWLLGTDTPDNIARRLGYHQPQSLVRQLERGGDNATARKFERLLKGNPDDSPVE